MGLLKDILERGIDEPGCLDRLTDYSQEVLPAPFAKKLCGDCKAPDDDGCDKCGGMESMCQLEYDIQTEAILLVEELIAKVLDA